MPTILRETLRALRRDRLIVVLMICGLAFGVGFWQLGALLLRQQQESAVEETTSLFAVELRRDTAWKRTDVDLDERTRALVFTLLTERDADALSRNPALRRWALMAAGPLAIGPENGGVEEHGVRFGSSALFDMFGLRFRSGRAFRDGAAEVVLTDELDRRWFAGQDSIGRVVRIGGRRLRVSGVLAKERTARQLDFRFSKPEQVFLPYESYRELRPWPDPVLPTADPGAVFTRPATAEDPTTRLWVEPLPSARAGYEEFLQRYVASQKDRTPRILSARLMPMDEWTRLAGRAEGTYVIGRWMGILVLAGCAFNIVRLAMVRSTARARELGILRALGEGRRSLFLRQVLEGALIGALAGAGGAIVLAVFVPGFNVAIPSRSMEFFFDARGAVSAFAGGTIAGAVAAVYPARRFSRMAPAALLRRQ
ncbi:MAG: ABC transporter permease [Myxococcales bacterium]